MTDAKTIVFLGDSITDEGTYISFLDAHFLQSMSDPRLTLINLGVSSETASGLSEPDHPFPRPCVHERLDRALSESRPDWVVICYGMNDGIYYPFAEERFEAYKDGMLKVIGAVQRAGAKAIVMTPPPFDANTLDESILLPEGEEKYSYSAPYAQYNSVLGRYSDWLLTLGSVVDGIVPIREPLLRYIDEKRSKDPGYRYGDGIHPDAGGHWIIAKTLFKRLFEIEMENTPHYVSEPEKSPVYRLVWERHRLLSAAWKEHVGHTNENKDVALPLDIAILRGEELVTRIGELSKETVRD
jgi:lysophospholipase L1-like esterase